MFLDPNRVDFKTAVEIRDFAFPSEERVVRCYQVVANCFSDTEFHELVPVENWLKNRWHPSLILVETPPQKDSVAVIGSQDDRGSHQHHRDKHCIRSVDTPAVIEQKKVNDTMTRGEVTGNCSMGINGIA